MRINHLFYSACLLALTGAISLTITGCKKEANELAHHHHHHHDHSGEEAHEHEHGDEHHHDGEHSETAKDDAHKHSGEISIAPEQAEKLGIKTTEIIPGDFYETITVGGELTPAPSNQSTVTARSAGIISLSPTAAPGSHISKGQAIASISGKGMAGGDANEAAQVTLAAAKRELDRLTPLHADGIVSTRDYNAARQAYETAKAAAGNAVSAGSSATAPMSGIITSLLVNEGQFVEAGTPIAVVSGSSTLTLRANLPERDIRFLQSVNGAKFRTSYSSEIFDIADFNGKRSSDISTTVAAQGYIPIYFTLMNNGTLSAGSYCEVFLTGAKRDGVISVPLSALSEQQGKHFVYIRLDEDCYEKRPVTLGSSAGTSIEITNGLHPGENVVTEGTTFVRLAESSGVVPEGHSHNH